MLRRRRCRGESRKVARQGVLAVAKHHVLVYQRISPGCAGGRQQGVGMFPLSLEPLLRGPLQRLGSLRLQTGCRGACAASKGPEEVRARKAARRKGRRVQKRRVKMCSLGRVLLGAIGV